MMRNDRLLTRSFRWIFFSLLSICVNAQCHGQEIAEVPENPAANPVPENALAAPPAFGNSGPERAVARPESTEAAAIPDPQETHWKPKLNVLLQTHVSEEHQQPLEEAQLAADQDFQLSAPSESADSGLMLLKCDQIVIESSTGDEGEVTFDFTCRSRVSFELAGSTIRGSSASSKKGLVTILNAVTKLSNGVELTSDKLTMRRLVNHVSIGPTAKPTDATRPLLEPKPDPIGTQGFFRRVEEEPQRLRGS